MNLIDYVIIGIIAAVLCLACFAIYRSKKSGKKCIGCPESGGKCSCNCGCSAETKK